MTEQHRHPVPGVHMGDRELQETLPAQRSAFRSPIPTFCTTGDAHKDVLTTVRRRRS